MKVRLSLKASYLVAGCWSVPVLLGAWLWRKHEGAWLCVDDPITRWTSIDGPNYQDVLHRSPFTGHVPTFFLLVRLADDIGGDVAQTALSSLFPWIMTGMLVACIAYRLTGEMLGAIGGAGCVAATFPLVAAAVCLRPYSWLACLWALSLLGLLNLSVGQVRTGSAYVIAGAGFLPHFSLHAFPLAALVVVLAWGLTPQFPRIRRAIVVLTLFLLLTPILKLLRTHYELPYHFWMAGAPGNTQLLYFSAIAVGVAGVWWMLRRDFHGSTFGGGVLCGGAVLALANPAIIIAYRFIAGHEMYESRYHVPDVLCCCILAGWAAGLLARRSRVVGVSLCVPALALLSLLTDTGMTNAEKALASLAPRRAAFSRVAASATPRDLIVIASPYVEGEFVDYYTDPLRRSYLLADALGFAGMRRLRLFPAPAGPMSLGAFWRGEVQSRLDPGGKVWFIARTPWWVMWDRSAERSPSGALDDLHALGLRTVSMNPEADVFILEEAPSTPR